MPLPPLSGVLSGRLGRPLHASILLRLGFRVEATQEAASPREGESAPVRVVTEFLELVRQARGSRLRPRAAPSSARVPVPDALRPQDVTPAPARLRGRRRSIGG